MRPIVKHAFKVSELNWQFAEVDGVGEKEANIYFPDSYIIEEAEHHLYLGLKELEETDNEIDDTGHNHYELILRDVKQLEKFIKTWKYKCKPHKYDGKKWEELDIIIKKREV
tara:strand:- start:62 stop:397 length:336 start_codon:yes stop_codon:yes gene_type:complete